MRIISNNQDGIRVSLRGLELQGTSCHAVEGRALDTLFENSFNSTDPHILNKDWWSAIQPIARLDVETYSDSRMSMVGIIDNPDNLKKLPSLFFKSLVWIMWKNTDMSYEM